MVLANTLPYPHFGGFFLPAKLGGAANTQGYTKRTTKKIADKIRRKSKMKNYQNKIFFGAVLCVSRYGLSPTPTYLHVKNSPPQWGTGRVNLLNRLQMTGSCRGI